MNKCVICVTGGRFYQYKVIKLLSFWGAKNRVRLFYSFLYFMRGVICNER